MDTIKTYMVHWIGPFATPQEVRKLEIKLSQELNPEDNEDLIFELYLLRGTLPYYKQKFYYCGESLKRGAGTRLKDRKHHINDYRQVEEIWAGYITNLEPEKDDVFDVEKITTAFLKQQVGEKFLLNETNKKFPKHNICIINRWYKTDAKTLHSKLIDQSPAKIIPALLLHYVDGKSREIHVAQRTKKLKAIDPK